MDEMIEIDTGILREDVERLKAALRIINGKMSGMYTAMQELNTMWEGPSNQILNLQFNRDKETMEMLLEILQKLADSMDFARTEYERCEAQVHSLVSSIRV